VGGGKEILNGEDLEYEKARGSLRSKSVKENGKKKKILQTSRSERGKEVIVY